MGVLLATAWSWLPSLYLAAAVALAGAGTFVVWIFLDCSFATVAGLARKGVRLQFVRDASQHDLLRWEWFGPRLLIFAILAGLSALASLAVLIELALGATERALTNALLTAVVVAVWIVLFTMYERLWWLAFRRRVVRLLPAMKKAAAQLLDEWPEKGVFLPGLGNYKVSSDDPDHLLHADRTSLGLREFSESVGDISRKKDCCLRFGVASYLRVSAESCHRCCVQYRMHGWSPPEVSVTDVQSPALTATVRYEYDFPLGDSWYLVFYSTTIDVKPDPEMLEEIAKRPPGTRLPHRGGRFRSHADTPVGVWIEHSVPGLESPVPMFHEEGTLPQGHVVRLDYEPDPSQSTHCTLAPEDRAALEDRLVNPEQKKDRDYAGYQLQVSYVDLDQNFEWLEK